MCSSVNQPHISLTVLSTNTSPLSHIFVSSKSHLSFQFKTLSTFYQMKYKSQALSTKRTTSLRGPEILQCVRKGTKHEANKGASTQSSYECVAVRDSGWKRMIAIERDYEPYAVCRRQVGWLDSPISSLNEALTPARKQFQTSFFFAGSADVVRSANTQPRHCLQLWHWTEIGVMTQPWDTLHPPRTTVTK